MHNEEWTVACRLRVGADVVGHQQQCKHRAVNANQHCNEQVDPKGKHALMCKRGGHVVQRHDNIVRAVADVITHITGILALTEQHISNRRYNINDPQHKPEEQRQDKPDISYVDSKGTRRHLDVPVVTPHADALRNNLAAHKPGEVARLEENE